MIMRKKKAASKEDRLFEYRIKYNPGMAQAAMDDYRYYMATDAMQALEYHASTMKRKSADRQDISVERYNPWALRWEDRSNILNNYEN
jgi:hypothetical protein